MFHKHIRIQLPTEPGSAAPILLQGRLARISFESATKFAMNPSADAHCMNDALMAWHVTVMIMGVVWSRPDCKRRWVQSLFRRYLR